MFLFGLMLGIALMAALWWMITPDVDAMAMRIRQEAHAKIKSTLSVIEYDYKHGKVDAKAAFDRIRKAL